MSVLDTLSVYAFATAVQLPFHLVVGSPWYLAAWAAWKFSRSFPRFKRAALIATPAAAGLAPIYGFHASMSPAYVVFLIGKSSIWVEALVSFLITWITVFCFLYWMLGTAQRARMG
jgi:hypothetical protein